MTKLLDQAIAEIRKLSDAEQDRAAELLLGLVHRDEAGEGGEADYQLTPEQIERVRLGLAQARRGEFADPQEIEELWRQFGL
ncbi:hypothetical protein [Xanthobacter versatilis]|uniref:Uncharacterized protein n=1 Tax=Xanthobacter autotrophicus (strain ATCC BAA-1158 / Py2) TaxID=78245 RepID=A7IM11_XANP2|nr:conserved hypothetical protein [Xanthobacter autotrophicus Py2]